MVILDHFIIKGIYIFFSLKLGRTVAIFFHFFFLLVCVCEPISADVVCCWLQARLSAPKQSLWPSGS